MRLTITFALLFSLRTISLAADVTVYRSLDYYYKELQKLEPAAVSQFPWRFGFHMGHVLSTIVCITNKPPSVTAIKVTSEFDNRTREMRKHRAQIGGEECYSSGIYIMFTEIKIRVNLYTSNILCSSVLVAEGRDVTQITYKNLTKEFQYNDICYGEGSGCVLVADIKNKCDGLTLVTKTMNTTTENAVTDVETLTSNSSTNLEITTDKNSAIDTKNTDHQSSQNYLLIYVISSVIGMCVIILVIYLIWVRKCCHRNSPPVETMELNTCNYEPFYLNMLFRRECDQEIEEIDQHHYEEITPQVTEGG